jgi:chromosome segregation ATPase
MSQRRADLHEGGARTLARDSIGSAQAVEAATADPQADQRYDFQRLERAVEYLIEEHQKLAREKDRAEQEHAALREELVDREQRLTSLEAELAAERGRRRAALEGVDKLIGRLDQLQDSVATAMERA